MKKLNYLWGIAFFAAFATMNFTFVSCDGDEEDVLPNNNSDNTNSDKDTTNTNTPTTQGYLDPFITWGANKSQVSRYMNGYELGYESDYELVYAGKGIEEAYYYYFDNSELCISEVDIPKENISKNALANKLVSDGYEFIQSSDTTDYYISADFSTVAELTTSNFWGVYELVYLDYEWLISDDNDDNNDDNGDDDNSKVDYLDPFITWGASKSQVKRYMSSYELGYESDYMLAYAGKGIEEAYYYWFDNSELCISEIDIPLDNANKNALANKLVYDGYEFIQSSDTTDYYISADFSTVVELSTSRFWNVYELVYLDYEWLIGDEVKHNIPSAASMNKVRIDKSKVYTVRSGIRTHSLLAKISSNKFKHSAYKLSGVKFRKNIKKIKAKKDISNVKIRW